MGGTLRFMTNAFHRFQLKSLKLYVRRPIDVIRRFHRKKDFLTCENKKYEEISELNVKSRILRSRIMAKNIPYVTLSNGYKMPMFALGTYLAREGDVETAVKDAIDLGYRHIDTAFFYENEKEIGRAIKAKIQDGTVKREELFVTTKVWNNCHKKQSVILSCKKSLENLGLSYVDLLLVHWPFAFKEGEGMLPKDENGKLILTDTDYLETWQGMEECVCQKLTHSIGVSNFNSEQITRLMGTAKIIPVNNQVEVSVNLNQTKLVQFCKKHCIVVSGYSPLGRPGNRLGIDNSLGNPTIMKLAEKYSKTPAQIALRYVYQQGVAVIAKSVNKRRIKENIEIFDFELTDDEMKAIEAIGTGERVAPYNEVKGHQYYPFSIPF